HLPRPAAAARRRGDVHGRSGRSVRSGPGGAVNLRPTIAGRDLPAFVPTFYPIVVAVTYFGLLFVGLGVSIFSAARLFVVTALVVAAVSVVINLVMRDR